MNKIYNALRSIKAGKVSKAGFALLLLITTNSLTSGLQAQVIWNGSTITFATASGGVSADAITANVVLTRGTIQGLYNSAVESSYTTNVSPTGTEWAYGTLANYASLTYQPWQIWNGNSPPSMIGKDAVLHLKTSNIYIGIKFLSWENGHGGDGGFSYQRTTAGSLPVTLKSFSAVLKNKSAIVEWKTATETSNKYFDIQHSSDGVNFSSVGNVAGNGSSATEHSYSFTHNNILSGKHYYRLGQVDLNGAIKYSQVVFLNLNRDTKLQIMPNPVRSFINLTASSQLAGSRYFINSSAGQAIRSGILNNQQIDVESLATGQYWLSIETSSGEILKATFIKQ